MTTPTLYVEVSFPTTASFPVFVLDDPTKGLLNGATYKLAGDTVAVDITNTVQQVSIRRGRTRSLDRFEPGTATITIVDTTGAWNPQNTSSIFYPNIQVRRQVRVSAGLNGVGYGLFSGLMQGFRYDYEPSGKVAFVTIEAADIMTQFAQLNISTVTGGTAGQLSGARVGKILDAVGSSLSTTDRVIDTGRTTLQVDPGTSRTVLDAIQTVVDSEFGAFFVEGDGRLRYADRNTVITQSNIVDATFNNSGVEIGYLNAALAFDDDLLTNECVVTPDGLAAQTASNMASQTSFGKRSVTRSGLLMDSTTDAYNQASFVVGGRAIPELRVDSIELDTWSGDTQAVQALNLDLLDCVVVNHKHAGTNMTFQCAVQGVSHDITTGSWRTRLSLAESYPGFVLNYSRLDTGVLTY